MDGHTKRILIVEDDDVLRRASALALERAGYTVLTASGGREGLAMARAERPDLIVLDLLMPRPTGLDVLRTLKRDEETRRIPVIVVSNSSMQRIVEEVQGFGDEYIVKANMSLRELGDRVARRLAKAAATPPAPTPDEPPSVPPLPPELAALIPLEPTPEAAPEAPLPIDAEPTVDERPPRDAVTNCVGCGFSILTRFGFCPRCGRKLATPRSWGALIRRVR
jgi:CheY-like chemotaxis protein